MVPLIDMLQLLYHVYSSTNAYSRFILYKYAIS